MLSFLKEQFEKKKLPENDFLPEEKDYYFKLLMALAQGDFETLNAAFPKQDHEPSRLLTLRFEKYLDHAKNTIPPSELQELLDNEVSLGTFISRMVKN